MISLFKYITQRNIAAFLLVLFCIQYIPLESRDGVSYLKLLVSMLCPFVIILKSPWMSKPLLLFFAYYSLVLIAAVSHPATLRWSTVLFALSFMLIYIAYYNLTVINKVFTKEFFVRLIRGLIAAYAIFLVLQQCLLLVGIKVFALFNLVQDLGRGIAGNALSYEPSSAAVILSFSFLSLLRMYEMEENGKLSLTQLWIKDKWIVIVFVYTMLGLVSGTAMVGLPLIALYFVSQRQYLVAIPIAILILLLFFNIDYLPLERARNSLMAFITLDKQAVMNADGSAAARIIPVVNTLTKLDLSSWEGWLGHGVDYGLSKWIFSDRVMLGGIADYGFLSFIVMQIAVYTCMIRKFFSLETLLWMFLGMMTLGNVPINWGAMMLFTTVRYFQTNECDD